MIQYFNGVFILGGGDLGTGVTYRLFQCGIRVVILELAQPNVIRRNVAFAEAVYSGQTTVEGVLCVRCQDNRQIPSMIENERIPVLVDPDGKSIAVYHPLVLVDARMRKTTPEYSLKISPMVVGLGPGFTAPINCHACVETKRGHTLGRVYWHSGTQVDNGLPEDLCGFSTERVLRAPAEGQTIHHAKIGDQVEENQIIAEVSGIPIRAPFKGVLRGLVHEDRWVRAGDKIGDVDPRNDINACFRISDKALAVAGAVLEAILTRSDIRSKLWT